jgi:hypothetical protein
MNFESLEEKTKSLQIAALIERLALTYEERIEAHESALQLTNDLKKAREASYAESQRIT